MPQHRRSIRPLLQPITPSLNRNLHRSPHRSRNRWEPPKPKVEAPPAPKPEPKPVVEEKAAPTGKAYVVQLGALKNADKVNEIVGKLRGAGYRVYTSPSTPVQGKITRILVGPDASKDKLKGSLGELKQLSGLSGVVMGYTPN